MRYAAVKEPVLLGFKDNLNDVLITITSPSSVSVSQYLKNQQLSQECGHHFIHCQDLFTETVITDDLQTVIIFIPLVRGIALVGVSQEDSGEYSIQLHAILPTSDATAPATSCSPSAFFRILDGYFAVCTNQTTNFIAAFEVRLNTSFLSNSGLVPTNQLTIPAVYGNLTNASNLLHIEIDRNHQYIIFAMGRAIFSIKPSLYFIGPLAEEVSSETCDQIHTLVPIRGAEFYAYCSDYVFTYDVGEQDWLWQETIAGLQGRGLVYPCPRDDTTISVFSDHIKISRNDLSKNVNIEGDSYSSGMCMGDSTQNYFAFMDSDAGLNVYALDTVGLEEDRVAQLPYQCGDTCYPLVAVAGQYLIVRDSVGVSVLDVQEVLDLQGDLSAVIEATFTNTPLVTVVALERPSPTSPGTGTVKPTGTAQVSTTNEVPRKDVSNTSSIAGVIGGALAVAALVALLIIGAVFGVYRCKRKQLPTQT